MIDGVIPGDICPRYTIVMIPTRCHVDKATYDVHGPQVTRVLGCPKAWLNES